MIKRKDKLLHKRFPRERKILRAMSVEGLKIRRQSPEGLRPPSFRRQSETLSHIFVSI